MIKKVFAISMVVLMLAGIFISVANFTASDLDAAWQYDGAWSELIGEVSYCWYHPNYNDCIVSGRWFW